MPSVKRVKEQRSLADQIIRSLNDMLRYDRDAIEALIEHRVPCSQLLKDHPSVQVIEGEVGMLGILNGITGTIPEGPRKGWGFITAVFNDTDKKLSHFERTKED